MRILYTLKAISKYGTEINGCKLYWNKDYAERMALDLADKFSAKFGYKCKVLVVEHPVDTEMWA